MWELVCEEGWAPKDWCFWTVVLEKTLESPLDCKEIQPVHSKRDQSWVFFGRNDAKAETPGLWPPHAKSWLIGKDPDAGRDWGQEEKGMTEDGMAGWHHLLHGHEFEWTSGVGDGQGGLAWWDSWGGKESDRTECLNWTALNWTIERTTISEVCRGQWKYGVNSGRKWFYMPTTNIWSAAEIKKLIIISILLFCSAWICMFIYTWIYAWIWANILVFFPLLSFYHLI